MITIYVAGSSAEPARVRAAMEAVKAIPGAQLALDWLAPIEAGKVANEGLLQGERMLYASADIEAIEGSSAFWFLAPETTTRGAWVELGLAMALWNPRAIVCSGRTEQSIFTSMCTEVDSDDDAAAYLRGFVRELGEGAR